MYYFCLEKLLNFLLLGQTHNEVNIFLSSYNIYSFHHRFAGRILAFIHKLGFRFTIMPIYPGLVNPG
jgi:hypothetical protein